MEGGVTMKAEWILELVHTNTSVMCELFSLDLGCLSYRLGPTIISFPLHNWQEMKLQCEDTTSLYHTHTHCLYPPPLPLRLYGWHFEEWTYDQQSQHVTVSVPSKDFLHFQLSVSGV